MPKKLTQEEFIQKATSVHGDLYDYSPSIYINSASKIDILCNEHGLFTQTANSHLMGTKCPVCGKLKQQQTNLDRYGVEHPSQNKDVQEKAKKTNIERYGYNNPAKNISIQEKAAQTNLDRYGVKYPQQHKEIREKSKKTNIERYGVENPLQNKDVQEKRKKTNIERYGYPSPLQNKEVQLKIANTNIKLYGHAIAFKNKDIQNRAHETNIAKFGTKTFHQSHMVDIISLLNDHDWLFDQYIIQNKTAEFIADELNIHTSTVCRYLAQEEIAIRYTVGYSISAIRWLESIMESEGVFIQHAQNGNEYSITGTRYKADGYCVETNTVYEFYGDCFHGNPDVFDDDCYCHPYNKDITAKELYTATIERENEIKSLGYNLVVMWENNFNSY